MRTVEMQRQERRVAAGQAWPLWFKAVLCAIIGVSMAALILYLHNFGTWLVFGGRMPSANLIEHVRAFFQ